MTKRVKRNVLRPDTTLVPAGVAGGEEIYVHQLPVCCLRSLKEAVLARPEERKLDGLGCACGRGWRVVASLDGRVLGRFVERGGERDAGSGRRPPAA